MRMAIGLSCALVFCATIASAQLGANCGEHHGIFSNQSGVVWFTTEQLRKMATNIVEPETPSRIAGFGFQGYVSFKILVDKKGDINCIWAQTGNPVFAKAANEALQYWTFKPMVVNGKPVEFVGIVKFNVSAK